MGHPKVGAGGGEQGAPTCGSAPGISLLVAMQEPSVGAQFLLQGAECSSLLVSEDPVFLTKATIVKFLTWNSAWFFASASLHSCAPPTLEDPGFQLLCHEQQEH